MIDFKLWLEVKYSADIIQQIKDKLSKDGLAQIWLDEQGNVRMGFSNRDDGVSFARYIRSRNNNISIWSEQKVIKLETIGNKLRPAHKKLIDFLIANKIIDESWKFEGGESIGKYVGYSYRSFRDPDSPATVGDARKSDLLTPAIKNIILYHGTTDHGWEKIKKSGALYPLFTGSNQVFGSESRGKHPLNKDHLYLATNIRRAWHFAEEMADDLTRKLNLYSNKVKPVLLQVNIPDVTKLRSDDDIVNSRMRKISEKLWREISDQDKRKIMADLSRQRGWNVNDESVARNLWRNSEEATLAVVQKLNPRIYNAWLASMLREDQVAYKGFIPLKFLKRIDIPND